jgi:hypothetical protein
MRAKYSSILVCAMAIIILQMTPPFTASAFMGKPGIPIDTTNTVITTGGYKFYELNDNVFYLVDSSTGRIWKAVGKLTQIERLVPVPYENSMSELVAQPDNGQSKNVSGRYTFAELQDGYFVLDTLSGNLWTLRGNVKNPVKFVLVPRKDELSIK